MMRHFLISIMFLLVSLVNQGQSLIGFGGGYYKPMAYESSTIGGHRWTSIAGNDNSSFYLYLNFKERINNTLNIGFYTTYKNQFIDYAYHYIDFSHFTFNEEYNASNYHNHYINFAFNIEVKPLNKIPLFINFGPAIDILLYSVKDSKGYTKSSGSLPQYPSYHNYEEWNIVGKKNTDAKKENFLFYTGISFEITKNISIDSRISLNSSEIYLAVTTLDFMLGISYQFSLPNFSVNKPLKKSSEPLGKPYILNK